HQGQALDVLGLDVVDAADVQEVVFKVVRKKAFHLAGVHATVGLGDVDDGHTQVGEDVGGHAPGRDQRPHRNGKPGDVDLFGKQIGQGQDRAQDDSDDGDHHRPGAP